MKTIIEIANDIAKSAKESVTLPELVEHGRRMAIRADRENGEFRLKDASVGGRGLLPEYRDADWSRIRAAVYEGRGG